MKLKEKQGDRIVLLDLSPEDTLLVYLSRLVLTTEILETIKYSIFNGIIKNSINWDLFLKGAIRHRLSGLIYHHFLTHKLSLPLEIRSALLKDVTYSREKSACLFLEIKRISNALAGTNLPVLLLKGPALIHQVYSSPLIRPFNDIDLLTPSAYVPQVEKCLHELGYAYVTSASWRKLLPISLIAM